MTRTAKSIIQRIPRLTHLFGPRTPRIVAPPPHLSVSPSCPAPWRPGAAASRSGHGTSTGAPCSGPRPRPPHRRNRNQRSGVVVGNSVRSCSSDNHRSSQPPLTANFSPSHIIYQSNFKAMVIFFLLGGNWEWHFDDFLGLKTSQHLQRASCPELKHWLLAIRSRIGISPGSPHNTPTPRSSSPLLSAGQVSRKDSDRFYTFHCLLYSFSQFQKGFFEIFVSNWDRGAFIGEKLYT